MKKAIIAAIAALVCVSAAAQLNVRKTRSATETIATLRTGTVRLCARDSIIFFSLPSTNQFDDPALFYLGEGAASAIDTLDDLVGLLADGDVGSSVDVEQPRGVVTIRVDKQIGVRVLFFTFPGQAGLVSTSKGELGKMKAALVKWRK